MGIPNQPLRGFVGQGMDGRRAQRTGYARVYLPGSYTFTAPYSGRYKFILHGAGGVIAADAGASGSYAEKTFTLNAGQTAALVVGAPSGSDTSVTITGQPVVTAGNASTVTPGVASGGDVMYDGSAGGTAGGAGTAGLGPGGGVGGGSGGGISGGGGAPGTAEFPGGRGRTGNQTSDAGVSPGGGQSGVSSGNPAAAGDGQIVVVLVSY